MKFIASRLSKGNKVFPAEITVEDNGLTIRIPGLFNDKSTFFAYSGIASVTVETPMIGFSTIHFKAQGTQLTVHGFSKSDVLEIRKMIEAKRK